MLDKITKYLTELFKDECLLNTVMADIALKRRPSFKPLAQTASMYVSHRALAVARLDKG